MRRYLFLFSGLLLGLFNSFGQTKIYLKKASKNGFGPIHSIIYPKDTAYIRFSDSGDMGVVFHNSFVLRERNNLPDGEYQVYVNDTLELRAFFKDGKKDSIWTKYYPGAKVKRIEPYMRGKLNELVKESGRDYRTIIPYTNDTLHGLFQTFYSNGKLRGECMYTMGTAFIRNYYHRDGKLQERIFYIVGSMRTERFDKSGRLESIEGCMPSERFKGGLLNGEKYVWSGDYYYKLRYLNNQITNWGLYHKDGELIAKKEGRGQKVFGQVIR